MKRPAERIPAGVCGEITMVGMWLPLLPSSSSQVMKTTVRPAWYSELATILGIRPAR